jgi:TonB family protein
LWRSGSGPWAAMAAASVGTLSAGGAAPMTWHWQWLWLAGAAAALLRVALGHWRMARTVDVPMAMTFGVLRPRILAPAEGLHRFDRRHEEAHVARRDRLWQLIAQLACALYWFHPLVWWAERRAACERERACDDLVLSGGVPAADYAQRLVDAARSLAKPPVAALAVSGEAGLTNRVEAILDPSVNRRRLSIRDLALSLALVMALIVPLAPMAGQQPPPSGRETAQLTYKVEPEYSEEARAAKVEGDVYLNAVVKADGSFTDVKVDLGVGYGLDEKAIEAIEQWQATPATQDGEAVDSTVKITVNFRLH